MAGGGSKPGERRGGRQKGTPNKVTRQLKDMIFGALEAKGGQEYLKEQADKNPTAFMTLLGKVLPMQITGEDGGPIQFSDTERAARLTALLNAARERRDRQAYQPGDMATTTRPTD